MFVCLLAALAINTALAYAPTDVDVLLAPTTAKAATLKQKIRAAYKKQAKKLARSYSSGYVHYKIVDVCGSSVEEMLVKRGDDLCIYTYKNGKVKLLLKVSLPGNEMSFIEM